MNKIKTWWNLLREHVHAHAKSYEKIHHSTHLCYFCMVFTHGPYHWAAGVLLILGIVGWLFHLGEFE